MSEDYTGLPPPPPPEATGKPSMKVIALAIICVILAASLVGIFAVFQPTNAQAQLVTKDKTISTLQEQVDNLTLELTMSNANGSQVTPYVMEIAALEQELSSMNDTLTSTIADANVSQNVIQVKASTALVYQQPITPGTDAFNNKLDYAGYIVIQATGGANTTYVETLYSSFGAHFDESAALGSSGSTVFPVLPGIVEVKIETTDNSTAPATISVTYYY